MAGGGPQVPAGRQDIFGRGSKQLTPGVLRETGRENIVVVATKEKLAELDCLRVDTGDRDVDQMQSGTIRVKVGCREVKTMQIAS
ncbi:MAG: hypothetical protein R6W82_02510 [bacterium]